MLEHFRADDDVDAPRAQRKHQTVGARQPASQVRPECPVHPEALRRHCFVVPLVTKLPASKVDEAPRHFTTGAAPRDKVIIEQIIDVLHRSNRYSIRSRPAGERSNRPNSGMRYVFFASLEAFP